MSFRYGAFSYATLPLILCQVFTVMEIYFAFLFLLAGRNNYLINPRNPKMANSSCRTNSQLLSAAFDDLLCTMQRKNAENLKQIFPEKEYRGLSPNFQIHVSVSELYIPTMELPFLLEEIQYVDGSWDFINRSQTHECRNWGWGHAIPRKGIYKRNFLCSAWA